MKRNGMIMAVVGLAAVLGVVWGSTIRGAQAQSGPTFPTATTTMISPGRFVVAYGGNVRVFEVHEATGPKEPIDFAQEIPVRTLSPR